MYKFILFFLLTFSLNANEPTLAKLVNVDSNEIQSFTLNNYSFYCKAYGILTLTQLFEMNTMKSQCRKIIQNYYLQHPNDFYFTENLFKRGQRYHIEFKKDACVIYAQGEYTLSELLLKKGLAIRKPNFQDKEFKASFYKAQKIAKDNKKGIWKDPVLRDCLVDIYK
jgi:hypothetical protein